MIWNIVSDSSCDLRVSDFASEKVLFETVPLRLQVGPREFIDNDALDTRVLLTAMDAEKTASSTACQKRDGRAKPRASMPWLFKV